MSNPKLYVIDGQMWHVTECALYMALENAGPALEWRVGVRLSKAIYVEDGNLCVYTPDEGDNEHTIPVGVALQAIDLYNRKHHGQH